MRSLMRSLVVVGLATFIWPAALRAEPATRLNQHLQAGDLSAAIEALSAFVKEHPEDASARFELGIAQYFEAVRQFSTTLRPYGAGQTGDRRKYAKLSYRKLRGAMNQLTRDLRKSRDSLTSIIDQDVKVHIDLHTVKWDMDGDGKADSVSQYWPAVSSENVKRAAVVFDQADVHWFLAQAHFLKATNDGLLAHDWQDFFERCFHKAFPNIDTPYEFLLTDPQSNNFGVDEVAMIHLINWPVTDKKRLRQCWRDLDATARHVQLLLKKVAAEEDDDREWIANPRQNAVIAQLGFRTDQFKKASALADDIRALIQGKKLLPLFRDFAGGPPDREGWGINLKRYFHEGERFDLVLWVHGSGVKNFTERGQINYGRWLDLFQGELFRDLKILGGPPFSN